jgi:hypothetical protein
MQFLSMKLAAVNPRLDFNIEDFFAKEVMKHSLSKTNHALFMNRDSAILLSRQVAIRITNMRKLIGSTCPSKFWAARLAPTYLDEWAP